MNKPSLNQLTIVDRYYKEYTELQKIRDKYKCVNK